jgi:hypothetical protein
MNARKQGSKTRDCPRFLCLVTNTLQTGIKRGILVIREVEHPQCVMVSQHSSTVGREVPFGPVEANSIIETGIAATAARQFLFPPHFLFLYDVSAEPLQLQPSIERGLGSSRLLETLGGKNLKLKKLGGVCCGYLRLGFICAPGPPRSQPKPAPPARVVLQKIVAWIEVYRIFSEAPRPALPLCAAFDVPSALPSPRAPNRSPTPQLLRPACSLLSPSVV